ncbi:Got1/Sft2-like family-domain-containing protein [Pavlovales sp. CCMP2436]|nr:Got1/Sft2-like family-domain-containing protein [Pavlovales sp. CCMP2436]
MLGGLLNFALASLFLPLVLLRPAKFALFFTLGNLLVGSAFAALRGAREQAAQLLTGARLPFTLAYVGSMLVTLYAALVAHSYLLVMLSAGAQLVALAYYTASYLPGGTRAVRLLISMATGIVRQGLNIVCALCGRRKRAGMLPL